MRAIGWMGDHHPGPVDIVRMTPGSLGSLTQLRITSCRLADRSSQHRGQACAEARLQLAEHRSQLADRGAGSPVPPIAACTSQLARRRLLRRESKADPILLSQNRRPHSRRSQHFGQEVKAEVNSGSHSSSSLIARCRRLSRRGYLHEDRLHACIGAG